MPSQEQTQPPRESPARARDKAEGDRETVTPDVEQASRVEESRESRNQEPGQPAPARPHDDPTPDQAE